MSSHQWIIGHRPAGLTSTFGPDEVVRGHRRRRGAFTAAGAVMRGLVPTLLLTDPDLVQRYDIEILAAAPELADRVENRRRTLTSEAKPTTRTRYYPHNRMVWIGSGLADVTLAGACGQVLVVTEVDHLDPTDVSFLAGLVRRADPRRLALVLVSSTDEVAEPLRGALARHAVRRDGAATPHPADDPVEGPDTRGLEELEAAQSAALMSGFYDQVVELGTRLRVLSPWTTDEERAWLATVKMTIAHQAMGQPDEAMELFDDACAHSTSPSVHMQSAYGRAMVYTRYYEEARRDLRRAKGLVNTAIVLAGLSSDEQRRAYNQTFNENGLALIDMHLGLVDEAVALVEGGIDRLDSQVEGGRYLLHRSVLRYNHAQLMVRTGDIERAIAEYTQVLAEDPHHPDYWFERAALWERTGDLEAAMDDYTEAIRVAPPYPEPIYNRGDLRLRTGDVVGARVDFDRVLELDPAFVDALVNRAALRLEDGDAAGAQRDIEAGLALQPAQPHLLSLLGVLRHDAGDLVAAQVALESATQSDPTLASAWANLGAVLHDLGDDAGCIACLERSLGLQDDPDVRDNLALVAG